MGNDVKIKFFFFFFDNLQDKILIRFQTWTSDIDVTLPVRCFTSNNCSLFNNTFDLEIMHPSFLWIFRIELLRVLLFTEKYFIFGTGRNGKYLHSVYVARRNSEWCTFSATGGNSNIYTLTGDGIRQRRPCQRAFWSNSHDVRPIMAYSRFIYLLQIRGRCSSPLCSRHTCDG